MRCLGDIPKIIVDRRSPQFADWLKRYLSDVMILPDLAAKIDLNDEHQSSSSSSRGGEEEEIIITIPPFNNGSGVFLVDRSYISHVDFNRTRHHHHGGYNNDNNERKEKKKKAKEREDEWEANLPLIGFVCLQIFKVR